MKCLIDTNVFIQLEEPEATGNYKAAFRELSALIYKHGISVYVHPSSKDDLLRDKNEARKKSALANLEKFPLLPSPPTTEKVKLETQFGPINKINDLIDSQILFALSQSCAEFLISEDEGVHSRAKRGSLQDRVFSVRGFTSYLRSLYEPQAVKLPAVTDELVYNIRGDKILDSVRTDYPGFEKWLDDCCLQHRQAWVIRIAGIVAGVCIYKIEEAEAEFPGLGRSLKLCTFKVAEDARGSKYGEHFLKTAFGFAAKNGLDSVYLTAFPKHDYLTRFVNDFGFVLHEKTTKRGELVFYKQMKIPPSLPPMEPLDYHRLFSPNHYEGDEIGKYVIPIQPEFHEQLFPEIAEQMLLPINEGATKNIPGNTLRKVYVCHAPLRSMPVGSIVLFYRSQDWKCLTTVGVVERTARVTSLEELLRFTGKRSVFSITELREMIKDETLVIDFRLAYHVTKISLKKLLNDHVLKAHPQSIQQLAHDRYSLLALERKYY